VGERQLRSLRLFPPFSPTSRSPARGCAAGRCRGAAAVRRPGCAGGWRAGERLDLPWAVGHSTIAGSGYLNWGWALTPQPKMIPADGSTIQVYVDGVPHGNPVSTCSGRTSRGCFRVWRTRAGRWPIGCSTQRRLRKASTIAWVVVDSAEAANGIGSRYFSVANSADAQALPLTAVETTAEPGVVTAVESVPTAPPIAVVTGPDSGRRTASLASAPVAESPGIAPCGEGPVRRVQSNTQGKRTVTLRALERLELTLSDAQASCNGTWAGYLVNDALGDCCHRPDWQVFLAAGSRLCRPVRVVVCPRRRAMARKNACR
jgi:hypothetical protein